MSQSMSELPALPPVQHTQKIRKIARFQALNIILLPEIEYRQLLNIVLKNGQIHSGYFEAQQSERLGDKFAKLRVAVPL
jgi:hypothetical protein